MNVEHLFSSEQQDIRLGLERMYALLDRLEHPESNYAILHVAGTNGKGSTCALLSSALTQAGYRVGLFTSPHLESVCERFRINGVPIPLPQLEEYTAKFLEWEKTLPSSLRPSIFERLTLLALQYFANQQCEIVILETGLGGRLDATNAIEHPLACGIANIGLDHTERLGDTLEKIAWEKAHIAKKGVPLCALPISSSVNAVLEKVAKEKEASITWVREEKVHLLSKNAADSFASITPFASTKGVNNTLTGDRMRCSYRDQAFTIRTPLQGAHQTRNIALALCMLEQIQAQFPVSIDALQHALETMHWPGRLEVLQTAPFPVILDGAHNPQGAQALVQWLKQKNIRPLILFGAMKDKDYADVLEELSPQASAFALTQVDNARSASIEDLEKAFSKMQIAFQEPNALQALEKAQSYAQERKLPLLICGSLYLIGQLRSTLVRQIKQHLRQSLHASCCTRKPSDAFLDALRKDKYLQKAKHILVYQAMEDEVELSALWDEWKKEGKHLYFPSCLPRDAYGSHMEPYEWTEASPWVKHAFGFWQIDPQAQSPTPLNLIEAALLPCVGFDASGTRLGHGFGYYDALFQKAPHIKRYGVAAESKAISYIPRSPHDVPLHKVFTLPLEEEME